MSKMIQIRNVPDGLHGRLKARAAMHGLSLSDYLREELERLIEVPTISELNERLKQRTPVLLRTSPARMIREERERR